MTGPHEDPVTVPREVFEGIETVRQSGATSYTQAADWVAENRDQYARAIFHGFRMKETPWARRQAISS